MTPGQPPFCLTVSLAEAGTRLDALLSALLAKQDVSREKIKRAIKEGRCLIDGISCERPNVKVREGQSIQLAFGREQLTLEPETHPHDGTGFFAEGDDGVRVLFQDEHLAVINKPAGLTVHPCPSCPSGTLVHRLLALFPALGVARLTGQEGLRPGIVHRLDKDTTGLMVIALTEEARLRLSADFAERTVHKEYFALVRGVPAPAGQVDAPLGRHPTLKTKMAVQANGKPALSDWSVYLADEAGLFSMVKIRIHTGRTHQIRVHMAHIGHPLWGDKVYGPKQPQKIDPAPRQMLHAAHLSFTHPFTEEALDFVLPPPQDMLETARILHHHPQRIVVTGLAGSGKSALLEAYEALGIPVWRADAVVAHLYQPGQAGWQVLSERYGERFVPDPDGAVDKTRLALAMQENHDLRREVESVVHGLVRTDLNLFWEQCELSGAARGVAEIPLWFESRWPEPTGQKALVVGITTPAEQRMSRLAESRQWCAERIAATDAWQWADEDKMRHCDRVIVNNGSLEALQDAATASLEWMNDMALANALDFEALWERAATCVDD